MPTHAKTMLKIPEICIQSKCKSGLSQSSKQFFGFVLDLWRYFLVTMVFVRLCWAPKQTLMK